MKQCDLHGKKHSEVILLIEKFVHCNQSYLPLKIITGDSPKMRKLVTDWLKENKYKYQMGDPFNKGYITVLKD